MQPLYRTLGCFVFLTCLIMSITISAQEKEEKKDENKPEEPKKKVVVKKVDEKVVYGQKTQGKVVRVDARSIYFATVDPVKYAQVQQWAQQQQVQLLRSPQGRPAFQQQYAQKMANEIFGKETEIRAAANCKVRTSYEPFLYDEDSGAAKKLSIADKKALKEKDGASNVPGYYADFDSLRPGQSVEVYFAKAAAPVKTPAPKLVPKKKVDPDDVEVRVGPDAVMIVILQDAAKK